MQEVILFQYDYWGHWGAVWVIAGLLWIAFIVTCVVLDRRSKHPSDAYGPGGWMVLAILGGMALLFGAGMTIAGISNSERDAWDEKQRLAALEDLGYETILFTDEYIEDGFIAHTSDGEYISGGFRQIEGKTWQIVTVVGLR